MWKRLCAYTENSNENQTKMFRRITLPNPSSNISLESETVHAKGQLNNCKLTEPNINTQTNRLECEGARRYYLNGTSNTIIRCIIVDAVNK